jgi:hypothetical protein
MASRKPSLVRVFLWALGGVVVLAGLVVAWIVVPIVSSSPQGSSGQPLVVDGYPTSVRATGDDNRTRELSVSGPQQEALALDAVAIGQQLVVSGRGYDAVSGIYVAVCKIPDRADEKPGPCLGGVPSTTPVSDIVTDVVEYGPSNWINDDWAWRLFGARSFDDRNEGTFTAYIQLSSPSDEGVDCTVVACGLFTRNDHTALENRVQDLYLPIAFAE